MTTEPTINPKWTPCEIAFQLTGGVVLLPVIVGLWMLYGAYRGFSLWWYNMTTNSGLDGRWEWSKPTITVERSLNATTPKESDPQ